MKMQSKLNGIFALLLMLFFVGAAKAQCVDIANASNCGVRGTYVITSGIWPSCTQCMAVTAFFVPPNSSISLPCPGCTPVCEVKVTVTGVGSMGVSPVSVGNISPGPAPITPVAGCTTSSINYVIGSSSPYKFQIN